MLNSNHSALSTWPLSGQTVTSVGVAASVPEGCVLKQGAEDLQLPWDNQHNLISKEVATAFRFVTAVLCLPLCFLLSFCTNLLNMLVFYKQGLKERVNVCLFSLSILDLLNVAVIYGVNASGPHMFAVGKGDAIGPSAVFFFNSHLIGFVSLATGSQVVSSVIAIERCLCILCPLAAQNLLSTRKASFILCISLLIVITGGFLSAGFRLKGICVFDVKDNSVTFQYAPTQFYLQNTELLQILGGVIYGLILPTLCVLCVTICTVIIVVKMKNLSLWRETVSSASESFTSRDLAVTRMIVGTSVLFIVCMVPTIVLRVVVNLVPGLNPGGRFQNTYNVVQRCYNLLSVLNSTVNFFVYYTFGSKFRQTVHRVFSSCVHVCVHRPSESKSRGL